MFLPWCTSPLIFSLAPHLPLIITETGGALPIVKIKYKSYLRRPKSIPEKHLQVQGDLEKNLFMQDNNNWWVKLSH